MSSPERFNDPFDTTVYFDPGRFLIEDLPPLEFIEKVKKLDAARAKGEPFRPEALVRPISS